MGNEIVQMADGAHLVATVDLVSERLGVAPGFLYLLSNHVEEHYSVHRVPKGDGRFRVIEAPDDKLKEVQRGILDHILPRRVHRIAMAFEPHRGILDNARAHCMRNVVLMLDLKDFFPSLRFPRVCEYFLSVGYPMSLAVLLAKLCTLGGHLPKGAPTSPHLANLLMRDFDRRIFDYCRRRRLYVTRYADDIAISGDMSDERIAETVAFCRRTLREMGLRINYRKLRVLRKGRRQTVTGLVVNEKPNVPRVMRRTLRQRMHYLKRYGLVGFDPVDMKNARSLLGSVEFVCQVRPDDVEFRQYAEWLKRLLGEMANS